MRTKLEELESLLFDWECGEVDEVGIERLREILKSDADARSHFVNVQMIRAAMQQEADSGIDLPLDGESCLILRSASMAAKPTRRLFTRFWVTSAASLLVCVLGGWLVYPRITNDPAHTSLLVGTEGATLRDPSNEPTARGVALLTRLVDVTWEARQRAVEVGEALPPGRFAIEAGHAQIEFFCGATVIVQGPAELELDSATHARVRHGRLRAQVPPAARGFSLEARDLKVVDLGTEFGLAVSADGANVHVFDGEVELNPATNERRLLKSGQAILRTADGIFQDARATPESFVDITDLEARVQLQCSVRYQRWKEWSTELRRDPRLIAYYAFDEQGDWQRRLACSNEPANRELDGAIVGAREVEGRWAMKGALQFKQPADRVRIQVPGEYGSLSLACWVKIDSLDRWYNSLFLTDGYDKGEPHWQILDDGRIYFSVRPVDPGESGPRDYKALTPSFWNPSLNGKWIHLAVTCNLETSTIIHYLNGEELSSHTVPESQMPSTTRVGTASIGNWSLPTLPNARFAIRNLNGSMDEFVILAAVLTGDEVKEIYEHGKP